MKGRLGQWLPEDVFDINGKGFSWKIDKLERKANYVNIQIGVKFSNGKQMGYKITHFDEGPDGGLEANVVNKDRNVYVAIKVADGTIRNVLFALGTNLKEMEDNYITSKAMPLWSWQKVKVIPAYSVDP